MNIQVVPLKRLAVCSCGHPALNDAIQLGVHYQIDLDSVRSGFDYFCGGCHKWIHNVKVVNCNSLLHPGSPMAPMLYGLFL